MSVASQIDANRVATQENQRNNQLVSDTTIKLNSATPDIEDPSPQNKMQRNGDSKELKELLSNVIAGELDVETNYLRNSM